jgi:geranylgeranylglycerol-phosphate geranylgeranyltransferase
MRTKVAGMLRLVRFELPFTAGMCVVLGEMLALGTLPSVREMVLGFLSFFFVSATALILNDYFDLETDRINAPQRPLPSGMVTKRDVVVLSVAVALLGFLASYAISMQALLVVLAVWTAGFLYNWRLKRTGFLGNLLVSFSVGMTFIFGGIVVGHVDEKVVWWFGVLAMLIDLGEEIGSDAMDMQGDRAAGSQSVAIKLGQHRALRISAAIFLLVVLISSIPFVSGWLDWRYLVPICIMDGIIIYSTMLILNPTTADRRKYLRWIYLSGSLTILLFIAIRMASN